MDDGGDARRSSELVEISLVADADEFQGALGWLQQAFGKGVWEAEFHVIRELEGNRVSGCEARPCYLVVLEQGDRGV